MVNVVYKITFILLYTKTGQSIQWKEKEKERKEKSFWPNTYNKYIQRFVGLSKYDYIRKMLNKNHLGKVPSKAAER